MSFIIDKEMESAHDLDGIITPYIPHQVRYEQVDGGQSKNRRVISYGQGSSGYDIRMGQTAKIFGDAIIKQGMDFDGLLDPKGGSGVFLHDLELKTDKNGAKFFIMPPNASVLTHSVERFKMPDYINAICTGKSTYARVGIIVNITPIEPGWEGWLTIEIANTTPLPVKLYANEGIAQILFSRLGDVPKTTYAKRKGKYQNQPEEIVTAIA